MLIEMDEELYDVLADKINGVVSDFEDENLEKLKSIGQEVASQTIALAALATVIHHCVNVSKDPRNVFTLSSVIVEAFKAGVSNGLGVVYELEENNGID